MTVPGKTDHFVIISGLEILVSRCRVHFTVYNSAVRFAMAYTVPKLRESTY